MTQHAMLNNNEHKDLRIRQGYGPELGDDVMAVLTFPAEFRDVQAHYPIVFTKTKEGEFQPLALFGFKDRQNLFTKDGQWDATYVPLMVRRQPFLIGAGANNQNMIHVDLDHPRVSRGEGELLFKEEGGTSGYLDRASSVLATIHLGMQDVQPCIAALQEFDLLESFVLDIEFRDGSQHRFGGFFTVQEEKLAKLGPEALGKLHERGFLQAAFMVIASLSNFRALIERASKLNADER